MSSQLRTALRLLRTRKCVILVCCSNAKTSGGSGWLRPPSPQFIAGLSEQERKRILATRRALARSLNLPVGPDVGGAAAGSYLPAVHRYQGRMYGRVPADLWPEPPDARVVIVSALYGPLFPWEPIQDYNLTMKDTVGSGRRVELLWRETGLGLAVAAWCRVQGVECILDLLTEQYRMALRGLSSANLERIVFEYPGRGNGSLFDRGDDLRRLLGAGGSWHLR